MTKNMFPHIKDFNLLACIGYIFYSLFWFIFGFASGSVYTSYFILK
jgi:hypothetical protein